MDTKNLDSGYNTIHIGTSSSFADYLSDGDMQVANIESWFAQRLAEVKEFVEK